MKFCATCCGSRCAEKFKLLPFNLTVTWHLVGQRGPCWRKINADAGGFLGTVSRPTYDVSRASATVPLIPTADSRHSGTGPWQALCTWLGAAYYPHCSPKRARAEEHPDMPRAQGSDTAAGSEACRHAFAGIYAHVWGYTAAEVTVTHRPSTMATCQKTRPCTGDQPWGRRGVPTGHCCGTSALNFCSTQHTCTLVLGQKIVAVALLLKPQGHFGLLCLSYGPYSRRLPGE